MSHAFLTVDLGFGDAGKGTIADYLTRAHGAHTVIRFSGGAQAGHRVVSGPHEHVFSQFGSGTLAGAATHLSRFMLLEPLAMQAEADHLRSLGVSDPFARTTIDERALVITPFQRAVNRLRELSRGAGRHGSCGMGVGETMSDWLGHGGQVLFAGDLRDADRLREKLAFLHTINRAKAAALSNDFNDPIVQREWSLLDDDWPDWLIEAFVEFAQMVRIVPGTFLHSLLREPGTVVFEASQGVLLDEWRGFHPYTTWSTTTLANAHTLLAEANYSGGITRIGITRAYATRHGAGPFVTEDDALSRALPDAANENGLWQQGFRVGWPDLVTLRYALEVTGPLDGLAVTCLDRLAELPTLQICYAYEHASTPIERLIPSPVLQALDYQEQLTNTLLNCQPRYEPLADEAALLKRFESALGVPIRITSYGPAAEDKREPGL